jgi:hypothetical protein
LKSPDINKRGTESVSVDVEIMNNVHKAMAWGVTTCPYCGDTFAAYSLRTLVHHLARVHPDLGESIFLCPTCLRVELHDFASFPFHWDRMHMCWPASSTPALACFIETVVVLAMDVGLMSAKAPGPKQDTSALGSYVRKRTGLEEKQGRSLHREIIAHRQHERVLPNAERESIG